MREINDIVFRRLHGQLREIVCELTRVQFTHFASTKGWTPAINAYRCRDCISICVELAGVSTDEIELQIEARRLILRGRRRPPEPGENELKALQILALEIDHGLFERMIDLPQEVVPEGVKAEQANGLLWIHLPVRAQE